MFGFFLFEFDIGYTSFLKDISKYIAAIGIRMKGLKPILKIRIW